MESRLRARKHCLKRTLPQDEPGFLDELSARVTAAPDRVALFAPHSEPVTYSGLWAQIEAIARVATNAGLSRKDVVAVLLPDGSELFSLFLGLASVAICAPLNPKLSETELEISLMDLGARLLIVDGPDSRAAAVAQARGILVLERAAFSQCERATGARCEKPGLDDAAVLLQTSSTTGKPRIVPLSHLNLRAMTANTLRVLDLSEADRFLSMMPLFHLQGLLGSISQILTGGSVICTSGFEAENFPDWLEEFRPTWYTAGPALHSRILPIVQTRQDLLKHAALRFVRSIGAPLPPDLMASLESALHVPVLEGYGLTEAGMVTSNTLEWRKPGSAGRSGGLEVGIMGEAGNLAPAGGEGEIVVRGPAVMKAYRNDAEANRTTFRNGWLHTGDLGRLDEEDFLFVTGRVKEIINRGGEKIFPGEIDEVLAAHPAVAEAVAFGIPHPTLGEDVAAAIVLRPSEQVSVSELRRFTANRLTGFKVPRRILFVDRIPKGPTGKPKRSVLAAEAAAQVEPREAPASPIEKKLAAIWKRVLGVEQIGLQDDFFSLGGDSFAVALMFTEVESDLGVERPTLDESEFLANPDLSTLARVVSASRAAASRHTRRPQLPLVALQPRGSRIPFYCLPGADENPYYFRHLAQSLGQDQPFCVIRDVRPIETRGVYTVEEVASGHIESMRAAGERGPYLLGGHCYGGIVAFEMARQLVARGDEVRLLVLFEAPAPGYPKVLRHWKDYFRQSTRVMRGKLPAGLNELRSHLNVLRGLLRRRMVVARRRLLMRTGLRAAIEPLEKQDHPNMLAGRSYYPKPLACDVVQFVAADEPHSTIILDDPLLGWREFTLGVFTVRKNPGRAAAIFKPPCVRSLAAQLRTLLDGVNAVR